MTGTTRSAAEPREPAAGAPEGVLVLDKHAGPTSHDIVDMVRRTLGVRRVGHTGTLDPFATGVLAVCVGRATRLVRFLSEGDKVYRASVRLGFATTTDDLMGEALGPPQAVAVSAAAVEAALLRLTGAIVQTAPRYSAKKVDGRRLYELARQNVEVERPASRVTVHEIRMIELADDRVELLVRCSPGTYIRALARDLGEALGVGGHLIALRRVKSDGFDVADAVTVADLTRDTPLVPLAALLPTMPFAVVGPEGRAALRHGRAVEAHMVLTGFPTEPEERMRILDEDGHLLALAVPRGFAPVPAPLRAVPVLQPDLVLID